MWRNLLRHRHQLKNVAIVIFEVEAPTAIPIVELSVVNGPGVLPKGSPKPAPAAGPRRT